MRDHKITGLRPLDVTESDQSDAAQKVYVDREIFRQIDENNRVKAVKFLKADGTSIPEADQSSMKLNKTVVKGSLIEMYLVLLNDAPLSEQ